MPNCLDFVLALCRRRRSSARSRCPINGRFKAHELGHVIAHADVRCCSSPPPAPTARPTTRRCSPRSSPRSRARTRGRSRSTRRRALRQVVDLGGGAAAGLPHAGAFDAAAERVGLDEVRRCRRGCAIRDVGAADVHVGHDRAAEGLPADATRRSSATALNVAAHALLPHAPRTASGTRCRCSTSAGSSPMLGCLAARRDVLPRRPLRRRPGARHARGRADHASPTRRSRRSGSRSSTTRASTEPT